MSSNLPSARVFCPVYPPVSLYRCPICQEDRVPILCDPEVSSFRVECAACGFSGEIPDGSKAASTVRRWIARETRRSRTTQPEPVEDPQHRPTQAELAVEIGGPVDGE
jgi:transcription elongation factor Elf1